MTTHAKLSASRVERVMLCPGSLALESTMPDTTNEAAERGTAIHKLAEDILMGENHGVTDADLLEPAQEYVDFIKDFQRPHRIEVDLTPHLSKLHPSLGGTADAIMYNGNELIVIDLKTGRIPVSATNNKQLMTYALGAYLQKDDALIETIQMIIFQPGIGIHQARITVQQLMDFQALLLKTAEMSEDPFAPLISGNRQCKYCKAKAICPKIRERVNNMASHSFNVNAIDTLLDEAALAITWAEAIQNEAKQVLSDGSQGKWRLKPGRKMVLWADKVGAEAYFAGNPLAFEIKSPSALKKNGIEVPGHYLEEKVSAPSLIKKESGLE